MILWLVAIAAGCFVLERESFHHTNVHTCRWVGFVFPPRWDARCGFDPEKEERLLPMLAFRDVNREA